METEYMKNEEIRTVGVDLGGTKIEIAMVDASGRVLDKKRLATRVDRGTGAVLEQIADSIREMQTNANIPAAGVGIGVAGQVDPVSGAVRFAPNLGWRDVPLRDELVDALGLPVFVTNDVRAATWGEWIHGAGQGCEDLVLIFVGTGIGGGVVCGGRMLTGCSNTAGELGHITIDLHGPLCNCGNRGCLESLAGGWAIARSAREAAENDPEGGAALLRQSGGHAENINARIVAEAAGKGDPMARRVMESATEALIAGAVSLVNAFNPCRLILGGGVIEGVPELISQVERGITQRALAAARMPLQVLPSQLQNDAGVVGAAIMAMHELTEKDPE
jgi:glucokinase